VNTGCEFFRPCHLGDQLSLELAIRKLGSSSLEFRIRGRVGDEEKFLARHKVALISLDTLRALPIPDDLRAPMLDYVAPSST
jgi:4-hydroxybenzoyl-CoA thioesterase